MKIDEKVRGLLQVLLEEGGHASYREVHQDDDRMSVILDEVDLVGLFAFLSALQGTGCRASVAARGDEFRVTVLLPEGWWRS